MFFRWRGSPVLRRNAWFAGRSSSSGQPGAPGKIKKGQAFAPAPASSGVVSLSGIIVRHLLFSNDPRKSLARLVCFLFAEPGSEPRYLRQGGVLRETALTRPADNASGTGDTCPNLPHEPGKELQSGVLWISRPCHRKDPGDFSSQGFPIHW